MKEELIQMMQRCDALKFGDFTLASGRKSKYYVDCRKLTLDGAGLHRVGGLFIAQIYSRNILPEVFAGVPIGADPLVTYLLQFYGGVLPGITGCLVRKTAKDHGTQSQLEGPPVTGRKVLFVEDVVTTGGSVIDGVRAVRAAGGDVSHCLCIVDRKEGGFENLHTEGVELISLLTAVDILGYNAGL